MSGSNKATRWKLTVVLGAALGLLASTLLVGNVNAAIAGAAVPGSTFEGVDGDVTPLATGLNSDWSAAGSNVAVATPKEDTASGPLDDSFAGGMKEDTVGLSFVTGSIPSNKSDLTRLRLATENASVEGRDIFLHLAWERAQTLGSANIDFEFNQNKCELNANGTVATGSSCESTLYKIPTRRAGDMLIAYDFGGNSGVVDLGVYRWLTSAAGTDLLALGCEASTAVPCWSKRQNLSSIGAVGAISSDAKFGEASINLNTLLGSTTCTAFGSVYMKGRSSSSFTAQIKDFIAPLAQGVTNCHQKSPGRIDITKTDETSAPVAATFQLFTDVVNPASTAANTLPNIPGVPVTDKFCSTSVTGTAAGTCSITGIDPGNDGANTGIWYWVVEGSGSNGTFVAGAPAGYAADATWGLQRRVFVADVAGTNAYPIGFTNQRAFKVVVLVCQPSDSSLVASSITGIGGVTKTSHATAALTQAQREAVCGLSGGATYSGTRAALNSAGGVTLP